MGNEHRRGNTDDPITEQGKYHWCHHKNENKTSLYVAAGEAQALEGAVFPGAFYAQDNSPQVQEFVKAYRQQYNANPDYLAAQGYTVAKLFLQALAHDKDRNRAELPAKLLALKGFSGLPWFKGFNANREAELSLYLFTIKGGAVQLVQ